MLKNQLGTVKLERNFHFLINSHRTTRRIRNWVSLIVPAQQQRSNKHYSTSTKRHNYLKEDEEIGSSKFTSHKIERSIQKSKNSQQSLLNQRRLARSHKRLSREIVRKKENQELFESFRKQRSTITESFAIPKNITGLFANNSKVNWNEIACNGNKKAAHTYSNTTKRLNVPSRLTYYSSEIQNTLNCIITHFVNSILVEINIRKLLHDRNIDENNDSFMFREALLNSIKDEQKKYEILKILVQLYDKNEDAGLQSFEQFFQSLDRDVIEELTNKTLLESDHFSSLEFYRQNYNNFKSSQYLNYDHSDTLRFIQSWLSLKFQSIEQNDTEYITRLETIFQEYEKEHPLGHLNLIIKVCKTLSSCKKYTPSFRTFRYLLDGFGKVGLYNYQSIIYDNLPAFKYKQSILASPDSKFLKAPKLAYHFQEIIEEDPQFLKSLISYLVPREDNGLLRELISFFKLDEVADNERILMKSNLKSLVSKSRFSNFRSTVMKSIGFRNSEPILVSTSTIYATIQTCIDLKQFEYIDLLINKLILHSVIKDDKIEVALSFGLNDIKNYGYRLLLGEDLSIYDISQKIFTKEIFKLLLYACRKSDDVGRLMWLTPHLDLYLSNNLESNQQHLAKIKAYFTESIIHQNTEETTFTEFAEADSKATIDSDLIASIHHTFSLFGIDGKLLTYDTTLDFNNTVSDRVRLTRQKIDYERKIIKNEGGKLNLNHYLDDKYFYLNPTGEYGDDPTNKTYKR